MRTLTLANLVLAWVVATTPAAAQDPRRITVMSYNVENLFDIEDNPAREGDNTYLPLSQKGTPAHKDLCERLNPPGARRTECLTLNWSEDVLKKKIANIATVIGRFEGRGPVHTHPRGSWQPRPVIHRRAGTVIRIRCTSGFITLPLTAISADST